MSVTIFRNNGCSRRQKKPLELFVLKNRVIGLLLFLREKGIDMAKNKNLGLHGPSRLLLWNYSDEEKIQMDRFLAEVQAPPAVVIRKNQGYLSLEEIIHLDKSGDLEFDCDEKLVLFYNIPPKGISFLIDQSKRRQLPRPIYAAVTEESIHWPFHELMGDLIQERKAFEQMAQQKQ